MTESWTGQWIDATRQRWDVAIDMERVRLVSPDETIDIVRADWDRDVYVAAHGSGYIVRLASPQRDVGFILNGDDAAPLIRQLDRGVAESRHIDVAVDEDVRRAPLMWPKVSSLAVWAVFLSAFVFVPVLGLAPAAATVVLLIMHRRTVRRVRAWDHSRMICGFAAGFLVAGLAVEVLTVIGIARNYEQTDGQFWNEEEPRAQESSPGVHICGAEAPLNALSVGAGSIFNREINWGMLIASLFVIVVSLSVHEAAHATTAWWLGDDFARRLGRVTLNPIMHIDPMGTILLPFIMFFAGANVFGWAKPVPVMVERCERPRRAHILISIAGPGSNLLLASASLMLLLLLGCSVALLYPDAQVHGFAYPDFDSGVTASGFPLASVFAAACTMLQLSFLINIVLAVFNMIPIPPLDGSWVVENLFPFTIGPFYSRIRPYGFMLFLLLIYSDGLQYLMVPVAWIIVPAFRLLDYSTPFY